MTDTSRMTAMAAVLAAIGAVAGMALAVGATEVAGPADSTPPATPAGSLAVQSPASSGMPPMTAGPSPAPVSASIEGFAFEPPTLTIATGTTLIWTNLDLVGHTVTSVDGRFASDLLQHGETFAVSFDEPGTYAYFCAVHPTMTGTIEVVG